MTANQEPTPAELAPGAEPVTWAPRPELAFGEGGLTEAVRTMTWAAIREDSTQR